MFKMSKIWKYKQTWSKKVMSSDIWFKKYHFEQFSPELFTPLARLDYIFLTKNIYIVIY